MLAVADRNRADRRALEGHPLRARGLQGRRARPQRSAVCRRSGAYPRRSCSRCSRRSPARRWPTSPVCPSRTVACDREVDMTQPGPRRIVPNFDDERETDRKLAIICTKGNLDMAYPGLVLANAALGEGVETHLFFTFWGFDMITKSRMHDLKFSPVGNTAMHPGRRCARPAGARTAARDDRDGDEHDEEADRRPRRSGGAGVPRPDRRVWRPPVGLPDVGGHDTS